MENNKKKAGILFLLQWNLVFKQPYVNGKRNVDENSIDDTPFQMRVYMDGVGEVA
jgi:hypothetical protein